MSYKTIVTVYRDPELDASILKAAASFSMAHDAHLRVLALGVDRTQISEHFAGGAAIALAPELNRAVHAAKEAEESAKSTLAAMDHPGEVVSGVAQFGALGDIVARATTLADLVILPKPYGPDRGLEDVGIVEAALFSTRTPILILPDGMEEVPELSKVVVAWNESAEALAATRAAMPFLVNALDVDIAVIDPPVHAPNRPDPGRGLAEMLTRHGVHASVSVLARTMPRISDVILRQCRDTDANLAVMGAYGHSRFREAILGGATRNMLEHADLPVLMAH